MHPVPLGGTLGSMGPGFVIGIPLVRSLVIVTDPAEGGNRQRIDLFE
jgi:hypothetical protein